MPIRRGEVYFIDFGPVRSDFGDPPNKEPAKARPAVVLSINSVNGLAEKTLVLVTVVPGTSGRNVPRDYQSQVRVPAVVSGLPNETVFRAFQIVSIDSRRFPPQAAGAMPGRYLEELERAVSYILGLDVRR